MGFETLLLYALAVVSVTLAVCIIARADIKMRGGVDVFNPGGVFLALYLFYNCTVLITDIALKDPGALHYFTLSVIVCFSVILAAAVGRTAMLNIKASVTQDK